MSACTWVVYVGHAYPNALACFARSCAEVYACRQMWALCMRGVVGCVGCVGEGKAVWCGRVGVCTWACVCVARTSRRVSVLACLCVEARACVRCACGRWREERGR